MSRKSDANFPHETGAADEGDLQLKADPALLAYEAELFADGAPSVDDFHGQAPVAIHLFAISTIVGISAIGPVFEALTPKNSSGIPVLQLMAVFFNFALIWFGIQWLWAKVLGPHARVWGRARFYEWKRWLFVAFVLFVIMKD